MCRNNRVTPESVIKIHHKECNACCLFAYYGTDYCRKTEQIKTVLFLCALDSGQEKKPVQWNLGSRTPLITKKSVHEQIFRKKTSRVTNGVSSNEHASRLQRLATSWEYWRESVSCCVTFAQYT
jgi:hypothetical protein